MKIESCLISKIISAVMLVAYGVIGVLVIGVLVVDNLEEYSYDVALIATFILFVAGFFALAGWAFCYAYEDKPPKYKILSPIIINLFIFGGCAAVVIVLVILYYAACFLFGVAIDIADLITGLII